MKTVAVVGPEDERTTLTERLVERLAERGRVAVVRRLDTAPETTDETMEYRTAGATAAYGLGEEGWTASGDTRTLDGTLDDLAAEYEYAVVEKFSAVRLPAVVVGDEEYAGPELASASTANELDLDETVESIEALEDHITLEALVRAAKTSPVADRAGAIATFTGRVRAKDFEEDTPTESLEFETYEGVADERMAAISAELEEREGVFEVLMHHRTGVIASGVDIVFVVVLAGHRREAFRTVEDGIDRLKDEVPIFKKEVTTDEEFWVHERA